MKKTLRVLIIEDYENDAVLLLRRIKRQGFVPHYRIISTSAELAKALGQEEWDIIISDYILPGFGGLEALELIQATKPEIPVIMVSGKINDEVALEAIRAGAKDYIAKDDLGRLGFSIERELLELNVRKQTKEALQESEAFGFGLLNNAPNPVIVTNPDTSIRYVNPAFEQLTGFTAAEIVGAKPAYPYWSMKSPPGEPSNFEKVIWSKTSYREEKTFRKKNGELFQVETAGVPVLDREENLKYFISNWVDITERKKMLEELRESELFSHSLLANAPNSIIVANPDSSIKYVNPAFEELTGYSKAEIVGHKFPYPWWTDITVEKYSRQRAGTRLTRAETLCRKKDGTLCWVLINIKSIEEGGKTKYRLGNWIDISKRKKMEEELVLASRYTRSLIEASLDPLVTISSDGKITDVNKATEEVTGIPRDMLIGSDFCDYFTDPLAARQGYERVFSEGLVKDYPLEVRHKSGRITDVLYNASLYNDDAGHVQGIFAAARDISGVKQLEQMLRQERDQAKKLLEIAPFIVLALNRDGEIMLVNAKGGEILGYRAEEIVGNKWIDSFIPEKRRPEVRDIFNKLTSGIVVPMEYNENVVLNSLGEERLIAWHNTVIRDEKARIIGTLSTGEDITDRKRAEEALRKSEEKYRRLYESMRDGFARTDMKGFIIDSNKAFKDLVGYSEAELQSLRYFDLTPPKWRAMEAKIVEEEILPRGYSGVYEKEYRRKDGTIVPVELRTNLVKDADGKPLEMWAVVRDITNRKAIEADLRDSEERYRAFFENSIDAILITSPDGVVHFANAAACRILGGSEQELRLASIDRVVNMSAPGYKKALEELSASGRFRGELNIKKVDGTVFPGEISVATFHDGNRNIKASVIIRDISDRRKAEAALKRSQDQLRKFSVHLQELLESEKKHLAAEIHDELGQMLTSIKIELSWLAKRIPPDLEPLSQKAQSMMELINETDKLVKRISSNLRPPILDDLGLNEALRWLCSQFQERTKIKCFLKVLENDIYNKRQDIDLFRIVQEALTNVARHSEATTVRITMQNEGDNLVITIRDNGKGISKSQIESDKSYGIMGMRERARMLGGELTIKDNNSKGTVVRLVVPARE
jgi:PAS domain S-box-containing protein